MLKRIKTQNIELFRLHPCISRRGRPEYGSHSVDGSMGKKDPQMPKPSAAMQRPTSA